MTMRTTSVPVPPFCAARPCTDGRVRELEVDALSAAILEDD